LIVGIQWWLYEKTRPEKAGAEKTGMIGARLTPRQAAECRKLSFYMAFRREDWGSRVEARQKRPMASDKRSLNLT